ncbi:MAG: thiamine phosphate synthase [Vicinamibacterales bacterium]
MILQLVTDCRRLAPGEQDERACACLIQQARTAAADGIDIIQIRERDLEGRALAALVRAVMAAVQGSRTRVVVNERLDVALACGAHGVHLRGDSMAAADVRRLAPAGFLVGRSVHSESDVVQAGPVDYLVAGAVWPTASKPDGHATLELSGLTRLVRAASVPVLAIGGVELESAASLREIGAAGVAAIGLWMGDTGACRVIPLDLLVQAFHAADDAANMRGHRPPR